MRVIYLSILFLACLATLLRPIQASRPEFLENTRRLTTCVAAGGLCNPKAKRSECCSGTKCTLASGSEYKCASTTSVSQPREVKTTYVKCARSVEVTWKAPLTGGAAITQYTVVCSSKTPYAITREAVLDCLHETCSVLNKKVVDALDLTSAYTCGVYAQAAGGASSKVTMAKVFYTTPPDQCDPAAIDDTIAMTMNTVIPVTLTTYTCGTLPEGYLQGIIDDFCDQQVAQVILLDTEYNILVGSVKCVGAAKCIPAPPSTRRRLQGVDTLQVTTTTSVTAPIEYATYAGDTMETLNGDVQDTDFFPDPDGGNVGLVTSPPPAPAAAIEVNPTEAVGGEPLQRLTLVAGENYECTVAAGNDADQFSLPSPPTEPFYVPIAPTAATKLGGAVTTTSLVATWTDGTYGTPDDGCKYIVRCVPSGKSCNYTPVDENDAFSESAPVLATVADKKATLTLDADTAYTCYVVVYNNFYPLATYGVCSTDTYEVLTTNYAAFDALGCITSNAPKATVTLTPPSPAPKSEALECAVVKKDDTKVKLTATPTVGDTTAVLGDLDKTYEGAKIKCALALTMADGVKIATAFGAEYTVPNFPQFEVDLDAVPNLYTLAIHPEYYDYTKFVVFKMDETASSLPIKSIDVSSGYGTIVGDTVAFRLAHSGNNGYEDGKASLAINLQAGEKCPSSNLFQWAPCGKTGEPLCTDMTAYDWGRLDELTSIKFSYYIKDESHGSDISCRLHVTTSDHPRSGAIDKHTLVWVPPAAIETGKWVSVTIDQSTELWQAKMVGTPADNPTSFGSCNIFDGVATLQDWAEGYVVPSPGLYPSCMPSVDLGTPAAAHVLGFEISVGSNPTIQNPVFVKDVEIKFGSDVRKLVLKAPTP